MNIEIQKSTNSEDLEIQVMIINGVIRLSVHPLCDCPEDAIIGRDLISCEAIASFMKEAYEAGSRGEQFNASVTHESPPCE